MDIKLYYHKTDGGAEYLMDNFIICPNGEKEGIFEGSKYIVRIDGDITKDSTLLVKEKSTATKCYIEHKRGKYGGCTIPHIHE